jgi:glycine/D-amino acid oxidase-like deaminating enzyme/nitrite reductase/ring-hydroxylating ferredoxin subunit
MDYLSPNSLWLDDDAGTRSSDRMTEPFDSDAHVEIAVIGAGITGLTTALHLKEADKRVAVLEAGQLGAGTTGGTSGHLDTVPEQGPDELLDNFGRRDAATTVAARREAIDQIETWCEQFAPSAQYARIPGYLYTEAAERSGSFSIIAARLNELGLDVTETTDVPLPIDPAAGIRVERQARFHPMHYLRGLAGAVDGGSGSVHLHTRLLRQPIDGSPCELETSRGPLTADHVVLATHSGFMGISQLDLRVAPYQSYVMAVEVEDDAADALYWDDESPYHYTRLASAEEPHVIIVGGADHKTGQADDHSQRAAADTRDHFTALERYVDRRWRVRAVRRRWSAEFFEPADGLPLVGRMPLSKHIYAATGFSGTGLTWGTVAGRVIADSILHRDNPMARLLSPARIKPVAAATDFVKENTNIARRFVMDRFSGERIDSLESIQAGEGKLVRIEGNRVAAYRAPDGQLHVLSSVCTHAGCVVQWNPAEQTWDCPCHGGRYTATGERLYGPPPADLETLAIETSSQAAR